MELEGAAQQRFLENCDPEVRAEVESMLGFARASEEFLETPAIAEATAAWNDDTMRMESAPVDPPQVRHQSTPHATPSTSTQPRHAMDNSRFIPGDIVAERYRIVGLLGRGGMGEVYRADDLKLSQPVALKFLAESLASNGAALARFHREVSVARQISHRHVCRVYDIGEHAGMHFLSMEYVRGEELSSLLKRIGRLPLDKAVETARQLCAGLAAIHAAGVLHRDLKPANVMIDEHGDVRITDFGVAALSEGVNGREAQIGTPAYMSPEQLEGGELTTRSDLYALGLVLYEAFTGNRPIATSSLPELLRVRLSDTAPTTPSAFVRDLDPLVERVILRCLERDPERRPATALQVAAALPGGDPLAAALAAGETPSPQMVAAAAKEGSLRPLHAALLLAAIFIGFAVIALLGEQTLLYRLVPLDASPEVLRARAAEIAREAGYTAPPADSYGTFTADFNVMRYLRDQDRRPDRWERLREEPLPAVMFWYRQSPRPLQSANLWEVRRSDPPNDLAGMVSIRFDSAGRLLYFMGTPPQEEAPAAASRSVDWSHFFERAGLQMTAFRPGPSRWTPPQHSDARFSWTGVHPQRADLLLRIEAASYRGAPVYFEIVWPWQKPQRQPETFADVSTDAFSIVLVVMYFGAMALAVLLAWKNVRLGRGDRRGTFRLMLLTFASRIVYWIVKAHHLGSSIEVPIFVEGLQSAVYWGALMGLFYLALEPFVRRRWPELLISWSRLLAGNARDPLVGRHILAGGALGLGVVVVNQLTVIFPSLLGRPITEPLNTSNLLYEDGLTGARGFLSLLLNQTAASVMFPMIVLSLVLFIALFTRRNRVTIAVAWLVFYAILNVGAGDGTVAGTAIAYALGLIFPTLLMVALFRHGLLALMSLFFFLHLAAFYPVTTELTAWYATTFLMQLALLSALAIWAFRVSLAGQKIVRGGLLDE
jgi:serine/threonine-protein kinase